jgi:hypothetical protein
MKKIVQVMFYQGVNYGGSTIKYIALDEAMSDATLRRGNKAELAEGGIGVMVTNDRSGETVLVPFNNVAYIKYETVKPVPVEAKKAK